MLQALEPPFGASPPRWHWGLGLVLLTLAVTLAHLWLADGLWSESLGQGAGDRASARMVVSFVRELAPATPPPPPSPQAAAAGSQRAATVALPPSQSASAPQRADQETPVAVASLPAQPSADLAEPAASAPATPQSVPALGAELAAAAPTPEPSPAVVGSGANTTAAPMAAEPSWASADAATTESAVSDIWPPSTRLSYQLTGFYQGPVEGQARVEWLRSGSRYQVHMDVSIGPAFAPLMSRRVSSEGEITAAGLSPRRFDEATKVLLRDPRQLTVMLDADRVLLANGQSAPRPVGVQDGASQFVQLTWLFTTQPALLQAGRSIELPLALPRSLQVWTYDVLGAETLSTPAGIVETVHVKPRREAKPGGDLTAEFWVAPSLQYLPVRILIRQDANTYLDLQIHRLPQQAAPGR